MRQVTAALSMGFAVLLLGGVVLAANSLSPGAPSIAWWTVDGGGGTSSGGGYTVSGTAGQPDAGLSTGGVYRLGGGFWGGGEVASAPGFRYYLPLVLRDGG